MKISTQEISRKLIHLSSLIYPILYIILSSKKIMLIIVATIFLILLAIDIIRKYNKSINNHFCKIFRFTIRKKEQNNFMGSTYFMFGTFCAIALFSQKIAILSLYIIIISDTFASIIGISYGKIKILSSKSLEGSLAFLISAISISCFGGLYFDLPIIPLIISSFFATILELFNKKLRCDDNILIPIGYGLSASILLLS
jgi:diacylglycerol kinase (CTP)